MARQALCSERRPRVLFLSSCVSGGGVGRSLVAYLKHEGALIEATVIMPEPGVIGEKLSTLANVLYVPEFVERIQRGPYRWIKRLGWSWLEFCGGLVAMVSSFFKIRKLCRNIAPDFIYCNHMLAEPVGLALALSSQTPLIIHVRNVHVEPIAKWLFGWIGQSEATKLIICNSKSSAAPYMEKSKAKVRIVPNSVDLALFDRTLIEPKLRQSAGLPDDAVVIGYLGRLVPKKGIDILLRAFALVHEEFPQARLALVGGNDHGIYRDMKTTYVHLARELGIEQKLFFAGFQSDVRSYLVDFDVLVLPSILPESFGRSLIEAMALKIPVITSAWGGAVEVVKDGVNGLWAKPRDVNDLARGLAMLLGDAKLRQTLGQQGSQDVHAQFDARRLAAKVTSLINEALSGNPNASFKPVSAARERSQVPDSSLPRANL